MTPLQIAAGRCLYEQPADAVWAWLPLLERAACDRPYHFDQMHR